MQILILGMMLLASLETLCVPFYRLTSLNHYLIIIGWVWGTVFYPVKNLLEY